MADYDDGRIACTQDAVVIRWYYFPYGTKAVPYADIHRVHRCPAGRGRIWGSGDFMHWRNLDVTRVRKDVGLILDTGRTVKPVITPDDPQAVIDALTRHGVDIAG